MKKNIFLTLLLLGIFLNFNFVSAQGLKNATEVFKDIGSKSGSDTYTDPQQLIGIGINAALTMVGLIFLVLMIYAGYLWMTARGEEGPIETAKKIITSSVIGFVLVASAYAITVFVGGRLETGTTGTSITQTQAGGADPSVQVCCRICNKAGTFDFSNEGDYEDEPDYTFGLRGACQAMKQQCEASEDCFIMEVDLTKETCNYQGDGGGEFSCND